MPEGYGQKTGGVRSGIGRRAVPSLRLSSGSSSRLVRGDRAGLAPTKLEVLRWPGRATAHRGPEERGDMRAVTIDHGELRWAERPDPVPGDTELLVAVRSAGLNGADLVQRRGHYPAPPGWPADIPGMELAGEVVQVGRQVTRFAVGDRVMALVGGGGQASLAVTDETHALPVPDGLSWPEAGGFPEVYCTAFDALWDQGRLTMGERALVTGAAGGVGTAAVQLAAAVG